jgi:hypothetical protein
MTKKTKFTPEQLEEFARAREEITQVSKTYEGKKARQNDKQIISIDQRNNNPEWQKNVREAAKDPKTKQTHKKALEKLVKRPDWIKAHAEGCANNSNNKEWVKKIGDKNREKNSNPEFIEKVRSGLNRYVEENREHIKQKNKISNTNPEHIANRKKGIAEHFASEAGQAHREQMKTIHAKPMIAQGIPFLSLTEAGKYFREKGMMNAKRKIEGYLKTDPENYYRISKEEYFKLTSKK